MKNNEEHRKNVDVYFGLRGALTTFKEMLNAKDAGSFLVAHGLRSSLIHISKKLRAY